jgi:hypothetical protein
MIPPPPVVMDAVEDLERNTGQDDKPYFMSNNLMKLLNAKNVQPKDHVDGEEVPLETIQS